MYTSNSYYVSDTAWHTQIQKTPCFGENDCLVKNKNTTVEKLNNEKTEKEGILINDYCPW